MTFEPGRDPDFERRMRDISPADRFYEQDTSIGVWPVLLLGLLFVMVAGYLLFGSWLMGPNAVRESKAPDAPISAPAPTPQQQRELPQLSVPKAPN